jgi:hypothetical protein
MRPSSGRIFSKVSKLAPRILTIGKNASTVITPLLKLSKNGSRNGGSNIDALLKAKPLATAAFGFLKEKISESSDAAENVNDYGVSTDVEDVENDIEDSNNVDDSLYENSVDSAGDHNYADYDNSFTSNNAADYNYASTDNASDYNNSSSYADNAADYNNSYSAYNSVDYNNFSNDSSNAAYDNYSNNF